LAALSVTATAGGNASAGILLRVLVLNGATVAAVPNTAVQSGAAAHTARIPPAKAGSLILAASVDFPSSPIAPAPAGGSTALDAVADSVSSSDQSYAYGTFQSGTTTAGTALTIGSTNADAGGVAALEVIKSASAAISTDVSSPASVSSVSVASPVTSVTTGAFTPPSGSLLVALVSAAADPFGTGGMAVTDSSGLTWIQAASASAPGNGYAGIWFAVAPTALAVTTTTLPSGTTFLGYGNALAASGGYPPYTWSVASGALPTGLNLFPDGTIRGQALTAQTATFSATVTDASGATATSGSLSLAIGTVPPAGVRLSGSWLAKADPYTYGTLTVPVSTTEHDWLVVSASWEDGEDVALGFAADDSHNFYRPMFYTRTGTIRTQVWFVNNARAAKNIYISTSAFVHWLTVSVHSFSGLAPWFKIDVIADTPDDGPGTSFPMRVTTTEADFVFAVAAFAGPPVAVQMTGTGATWHSAGSHSSGDSTSGVSQATAWAVTTAGGTLQTTFSQTGANTYSGGICAVRFGIPALANPNPAWPLIHVEAAFGYPVGNPTNLPSWTDISSRFLGLSGERGRSFELDELSASDLELTLDNFDGVLTPFNQRNGYDLDLMTPVRAYAEWQGRRYMLGTGLITAVPQTFDFQRGIVKLKISDDYSKLPQILLPSCMISELLYDDPLDLWPLNDSSGAKFASNWSGRSTATLVPVAAKYGGGGSYDGAGSAPSITTGFGNSIASTYPGGLNGTTDSVWGNATTIVSSKVNAVHGTALAARDYAGVPLKKTGGTYEVWALLANESVNWSTGATLISIGDDKGSNGGGNFLTLTIPAGPVSGKTYTGGAQVLVVSQGNLSSNATHSFKAPVDPWKGSGWHHYAVTVGTNGTVSVYMDGTLVGQFAGKFPSGTPNWISFGGDPKLPPVPIVGGTVKGVPQAASVAGLFTGFLANAVIYDRVIDAQRIKSHYLSGATGYVGETAGPRISRLLTYAKWAGPQAIEDGVSRQQQLNYLGGGYASSGLSGAIGQYSTTGGGFTDQGAQVDVTVQDVAAGELGFLFVGTDGTLTFRERRSTFNRPVAATFGDMDFALNEQSGFSSWLANGGDACTVTLSSSWSYAGGESALLTVTGPTGGSIQPRTNPVPVYPGDTLGGSAWVMSPQGAQVRLSLDWKDSSGNNLSTTNSAVMNCPPLTPVFLSIANSAAPANCASVTFHPTIVTTTAGTEVYCDRIRLSPAGFQVPYNDDVEITVDSQYLYNDVVISRNYDQATYRAVNKSSRDKYYPRVFTRTLYTDLADSSAVVDIAQWLLADYSSPHIRVSRVTVDAAACPDAWPVVLGLDIGDLVNFERNPVGGDPVSETCQVLSVELDIEPDKAQFTYVLAPIIGGKVITLDDPVFGVVGGKLAL
jgi:hypothetical protein